MDYNFVIRNRLSGLKTPHRKVLVARTLEQFPQPGLRIESFKGIWQYIFLLFHCKELLKLYVNLLYRFCVTILFLEIF